MAFRGFKGNPLLSFWWGLYHKQKPPEASIEPAVASMGYIARFQHPIRCGAKTYFADFALPQIKVILEVDGDEHRTFDGIKDDLARTAALNQAGWTVLRCTNDEALEDPYGTVARLFATYLATTGESHNDLRTSRLDLCCCRRCLA